jgi:hypothetical protein
MFQELYQTFYTRVPDLPPDSWAVHRTETIFKKFILYNIYALMYYFDMGYYNINQETPYPGDRTDMEIILVCLTLLLVGANACTCCIIDSVWRDDKEARLSVDHGVISP